MDSMSYTSLFYGETIFFSFYFANYCTPPYRPCYTFYLTRLKKIEEKITFLSQFSVIHISKFCTNFPSTFWLLQYTPENSPNRFPSDVNFKKISCRPLVS